MKSRIFKKYWTTGKNWSYWKIRWYL